MKTLSIVVIAALLALPAAAGDAKPAPAKSSWSTFLENLKASLANSAVAGQQKHGKTSRAVAAVRGAEQGAKNIADPNEPQLKGSSKEKKAAKEIALNKQFDDAVNLLIDKKYEDGIKALQALKDANPKYRVEDVNQALDGAKAELAAKNNGPVPEPAAKP